MMMTANDYGDYVDYDDDDADYDLNGMGGWGDNAGGDLLINDLHLACWGWGGGAWPCLEVQEVGE